MNCDPPAFGRPAPRAARVLRAPSHLHRSGIRKASFRREIPHIPPHENQENDGSEIQLCNHIPAKK